MRSAFFLGETKKVLGKLAEGEGVESDGNALVVIQLGERAPNADEKFFGAGEAELEGGGFRSEFARELDRCREKDNGNGGRCGSRRQDREGGG